MTVEEFDNLKFKLDHTIPGLNQQIEDLNNLEKQLKNRIQSKKGSITGSNASLRKMKSNVSELKKKESEFDTIKSNFDEKISMLKLDIPKIEEKLAALNQELSLEKSEFLEPVTGVHKEVLDEFGLNDDSDNIIVAAAYLRATVEVKKSVYLRISKMIFLFALLGLIWSIISGPRISNFVDLFTTPNYVIIGVLCGLMMISIIIKHMDYSFRMHDYKDQLIKDHRAEIRRIENLEFSQSNQLEKINDKIKNLKNDLRKQQDEILSIPKQESRINQLEEQLKTYETELLQLNDEYNHVRNKEIPRYKSELNDEWQSIRHLVPFSDLIKLN